MRKYLLAAAAAAAIATPAVARDGSGYFGVEGGVLFAKDSHVTFNGAGTYYSSEGGSYDFTADADFKTNYKTGYDLDLIAGYDLGMVRLEAELGYKRSGHKSYDNATFVLTSSEGSTYTSGPVDVDADGRTTVLSAMANALLDFGNENGASFYVGGGVGWASTKYRVSLDDPNSVFDSVSGTAKDSGLAWQVIAGMRYAISPNMDVGLKYRYFHGNKVKETFDFVDEPFDVGTITGSASGHTRFKSHSLLASLIFNFGGHEEVVEAAPPPPPPPPPAPPATQTCMDGSVILATEACPAPPPPPPPPPPAPERG